ncbi:hypothetical protein H5T89_07120 [bacterium]|nr:hypothetical protein [bacterium]
MKKLLVGVLVASMLLIPILAIADEGSLVGENRVMVNNLLLVFPNLLTEELINQLRNEGYGYGEIAIICIIASESNTSLQDVINYAKENNLGWGEVASYYGVKFSKLGLVINQKDRGESAGMNYLLRESNRLSNKEKVQQQTRQQTQQYNQQQTSQVQEQVQQQVQVGQQNHREQHGPGGGKR